MKEVEIEIKNNYVYFTASDTVNYFILPEQKSEALDFLIRLYFKRKITISEMNYWLDKINDYKFIEVR